MAYLIRDPSSPDLLIVLIDLLSSSHLMLDMIVQSIFIISRRDIVSLINDFIVQRLSLTPTISYVIDTEGNRILTSAESAKSFKHYIDLSEEANLYVDARAMFLDNFLIQCRISNDIIGTITELLHDDADNISVYPIVIFPTENNAEISIPLIP